MSAAVDLRSAVTLPESDLVALFNAGFSDYLVGLQLSPAAFREHVVHNDIDLGRSQVAVADRPAALALIAQRGTEAWVGGMGTAPPYRRQGLGERALVQGLEAAVAAGAQAVWLEVLEDNQPAIHLYEKLGFAPVRALSVFSLEAADIATDALAPDDLDEVHAWIVASRAVREPWQRDDATLRRMREHGAGLGAGAVVHDGVRAAAIVFRPQTEPVTVLQWAARDNQAATELLRAMRRERSLRLANVGPEDPLTGVLAQLGAQTVARQLEMRLAL